MEWVVKGKNVYAPAYRYGRELPKKIGANRLSAHIKRSIVTEVTEDKLMDGANGGGIVVMICKRRSR